MRFEGLRITETGDERKSNVLHVHTGEPTLIHNHPYKSEVGEIAIYHTGSEKLVLKYGSHHHIEFHGINFIIKRICADDCVPHGNHDRISMICMFVPKVMQCLVNQS